MRDKKGQMNLAALYPAVIAIVLIGIALGVGIFVLGETGRALSDTTFTVSNETVAITESPVAVATATTCGFKSFVVTQVTNATSINTIGSGNYTVDAALGTIKNVSGIGFGDNWNVSYTYTAAQTGTNACSSMTTAGTGLGGLATWIAVIVVVLAAAIVLGVVISSFGRKTSV